MPLPTHSPQASQGLKHSDPRFTNMLQGSDEEFDAAIQNLKKAIECIGFHLAGTKSAKTRFEAMLGA